MSVQTESKPLIGEMIGNRRSELAQLWHANLRKAWGSAAESLLSILQRPGEVNLLDVVLTAMSSQDEIESQTVQGFIKRVRRRDYSISDLFNEFVCLEDALREFLPAAGIRPTEYALLFGKFKTSFCRLFGLILRETSEFYEHVIERGNIGFCQTDKSGRIVYANREMKRIYGSKDLTGRLLTDFFEGFERELVQKDLLECKDVPEIQPLHLRSVGGTLVPVGAEVAGVFISGEPIGGYAHLTDISRPVQLRNEVYDRLMLGIIRLNAERRITFMNQSLCEMLDYTNGEWRNQNIEWLIPDGEDERIIRKKLDERFEQGKSDEYDLRFRRRDGKPIPVKITAAPEKTATGQVIRTIGIIRSMVRERIHMHIERERDFERLLQAVMEEMRCAIPFQRVSVALFSSDEMHVRRFFSYPIDSESEIKRRWYKITPAMLAGVKANKIVIVRDIEKFYSQPEFTDLRSDSAVQEILENYASFISYPVFREGRLIASASFYSKNLNRYGEKDRRILENLPLASAILMAIHYEEKKNLEFLLNLSKQITEAGEDMKQIAQVLVDKVSAHYDWENVALFNTSKAQQKFHLLSQRTSKAFRIPKDYTQPIDRGVLGMVYRTKKPVNIGNVKDEAYRDVYKPTITQTHSELCIPIESGELFWLLNIEDSREDAFSKDEELDLMRLIKEVIVFLERSWLRKFLEAALLSTSDAVWVTDNQGRINRINPAAKDLLGYQESELVGSNLADIFRDPGIAKRMIDKKKEPNLKIGLRTREGKFVNVLLSKFKLQEYFATNVYIAKDLSAQERLEELEYLGKMYYEIATQTQTPLMLISGWLERLGRQNDDEDTKAVVDRSLRQLRKIELTYDRLSFYDKEKISEPDFPNHKILCSFEEVWRIVEGDLPQNELDRIEIELECEGPLIEGDLFQLSFCFETILSYLMRFLPQDQKVYVHVYTMADQLHVNIKGSFPGLNNNSDHAGTQSKVERTLVEMALGEKILREFIVEKHGGSYSRTSWSEEQVEFFITMPLAEEG